MKTGWRIALYLIIMTVAGFFEFKDILFSSSSPADFNNFVDNEVPVLMKKQGIPGASIAIIQNGRVTQITSYGHADRKNNVPISKETRFRIASISKPLTAWGIMKLVEKDMLELDRPVEDYLTRWKFPESDYDSKEVTTRRLLTHSAGVSVPSYGGYAPDNKRTTIIESLNGENVAYGPVTLNSAPGTATRYSGGGYSILQLLIEDITGQTFDEYMEEEIVIPLGLRNYSYTYEPLSDGGRLAKPYGRNGRPLPIYLYTEKAAGGFICSIEDLASFLLAFTSDQIVLSRETIDTMTDKNGIPIIGILENGSSKCIGFGGTTLGYSADMWLDLSSKSGYVSMYNSTNGVYLGAEIADQWLREYASTPDPTRKILNLEFYGIRLMAFILGNIFIILMYRRYRKYRLHREHFHFGLKKKNSWLRIIYVILILSVILFWWIGFHTLTLYPPINTPWLPDSFVYVSIFTTLILTHSVIRTLFIRKVNV